MRTLLGVGRAREGRLRRALPAAAAIAALGIGLSACGSDDDGGSKGATGEVEITCGSCQANPSDPSLQWAYEMSQRFNKEFAGRYRVKSVKNQNAGASPDRLQYYQRLALADDLPDVFQVAPFEARSLAQTGKLVDFAPLLDEDTAWKDSFNADAFAGVTGDDGQIWAIPETRDSIGIYYNKRILADAGVSGFPETWDELETACTQIKTRGKTCFAMDGEWVTLLMWANMIGTHPSGTDFLDAGIRDGDYSEDAAVVEVTERLKRWHDQGFINSDAFSGEYQSAATAFVNGEAAMIANGPWMVNSDIKTKNAAKGLYEDVGYEISPGWTADERGLIVLTAEGSFASGATDEPEQEAVIAFLRFLGSHEQALAQVKIEGAWPAVRFEPTPAEAKTLEPLAVALVERTASVPRTYPTPYFNAPPQFATVWRNLWPSYVKGDIGSTQEFLSKLADDSQSTTG